MSPSEQTNSKRIERELLSVLGVTIALIIATGTLTVTLFNRLDAP